VARARVLQDGINLPDELHANVQSSFRNNTTELEVVWYIVVFRTRFAEERIVLLVAGWGLAKAASFQRIPLRCRLVLCVCRHECNTSGDDR